MRTMADDIRNKGFGNHTISLSHFYTTTELFNISVNDFDAKKSTLYSQVFAVTELVVSGTQCKLFKIQAKCGNIQTEQEIERLGWRIK